MKRIEVRMTKRDAAQLYNLVAPFFRQKRGMFPKGHRPVLYVGSEPIEPSPEVTVRLIGSTNSKKATIEKTSIARKRRPRNLEKAKELSLEELGLRTKTINLLAKKKISTVGGLLTWVTTKEAELMMIPQFSVGLMEECWTRLKKWGFKPE